MGKLPLPSDHPATPSSWRMRDRLFRSHSNHSASAEDVTPRQFSADGTFGKELIKLLQERKVTLLWRVDPTTIKRSETYCCNLSLVRYKLRCQQALISRPAGAVRELSTIGKQVGAFQLVVFLFSLFFDPLAREGVWRWRLGSLPIRPRGKKLRSGIPPTSYRTPNRIRKPISS